VKRPRFTLRLLSPRRRLRDRLLAAMLVVALGPAAAFLVLTIVNLNGITQQTVQSAESSIFTSNEQGLEAQLKATAATIDASLASVSSPVVALAQAAARELASKPAPAAVSVREEAGGLAVVTLSSVPPAGSLALLVGSPPHSSTQTAAQRGATLASLANAQTDLAQLQQKLGDSADAVWILDVSDNAYLVSPAPTAALGSQLALNPQGAPAGDVPTAADPLGALSTGVSPAPQWSPAYLSPFNGDWVTSVYADAGSGLVAGADIPIGAFSAALPTTQLRSAYPLLVGNTGLQVLATPSPAPAPLNADYPKGLTIGDQLPAPAGNGGAAVTSGLQAMEAGGLAQTPVAKTRRGDELFFAAPLESTADPGGPPWLVVVAAPTSDFEPSAAPLQIGINSALSRIFEGAIPILIVLLVVCLVLATLLSRLIVSPVKALTASAERLAQGHTDEPVPAQSRDEVGELADSLERMRREINASREEILAASRELEQKVALRTAELSARNEELLALNELAGSLTRSLDPDAILTGALDAVRAVLPVAAGRGFLADREGRLAARGPAGDERGPLLEEIALAAHSNNHLITRQDGSGTLIGMPLSTASGAMGALGLRSATLPGTEMSALLVAIGNQVGLALRTARLSQEGREMAVLEERARLAREIHDTLAQQLTGIVIQLEAAQALVSRDPERSAPALASAQELARSALAEARRSVWDLRPAPLTSTGLVAAAETEVGRFRRRTGISARLRAERMTPPPALSPQSEVALLRITQQALANIAAHSGASRVTVRLRHSDGQVELTVKDNGHGFDPETVAPGSFGIVGMAERVRLAGGTFEVESAPGRGTSIVVRLAVTDDTRTPADRGAEQAVTV
jgi:two-component system NarL family sensor kinase